MEFVRRVKVTEFPISLILPQGHKTVVPKAIGKDVIYHISSIAYVSPSRSHIFCSGMDSYLFNMDCMAGVNMAITLATIRKTKRKLFLIQNVL